MDILMVGGSGLIGRTLTDSLTQNFHQVTILSRNPSQVHDLPQNAQVVYWDGRSPKGWEDQMNQADVVVNLAGNKLAGDGLLGILLQRWGTTQKQRITDSRRNSGAAVLQAVEAASHKPKLLLQASAVGYYGNRGDQILDESASPGSDYVAQLCQNWEVSTRAVESLGVRHVVMRIGLVLSIHDGLVPVMLLPMRFFLGGRMGSGDQYMSWIHLEDTVAAIQFLIEKNDSQGIYNLTSPKPVTNAMFNQVAAGILHRPASFRIPAWGLKFLLGEKASLVLHGQRVIPEHLLQSNFSFKFPDLKLALQNLINSN